MIDEIDDFAAVPHTGGVAEIIIQDTPQGRAYRFGYKHANMNPASIFFVWALIPDGLIVQMKRVSGMGEGPATPPLSSCIEVLIASDSEGLFGRRCPECSQYFRSNATPIEKPTTCPYCGIKARSDKFCTPGQIKYVQAYTQKFVEAYESGQSTSFDFDALAKETEANALYYAEERQQTRIDCSCRATTDISGLHGNCPACGRRNNVQVLNAFLDGLQNRVTNPRFTPFEGFARDLMKELAKERMTAIRRKEIEGISFHSPIGAAEAILRLFGIDILAGISMDDREFIKLRFLRRHVYEHCAGVADAEYVRDTGGQDVQLGHLIRERRSQVGTTIRLVKQMAENLDQGFHART
jgi:hypothetical protein